MKRILTVAFALAAALILTGCSDSPTDVAKKWHSALRDGDVNTANKYSTARVAALNGFVVAALKDTKSEEKIKEFNATEFEGEEIKGDTAKVFVKGDKKPITLVKVDGDWKVDVEK